ADPGPARPRPLPAPPPHRVRRGARARHLLPPPAGPPARPGGGTPAGMTGMPHRQKLTSWQDEGPRRGIIYLDFKIYAGSARQTLPATCTSDRSRRGGRSPASRGRPAYDGGVTSTPKEFA